MTSCLLPHIKKPGFKMGSKEANSFCRALTPIFCKGRKTKYSKGDSLESIPATKINPSKKVSTLKGKNLLLQEQILSFKS